MADSSKARIKWEKKIKDTSYTNIIAQSLLAPYLRKPELVVGSSSGLLHSPLARASTPGYRVGYLGSLYALVTSLRLSSMLRRYSASRLLRYALLMICFILTYGPSCQQGEYGPLPYPCSGGGAAIGADWTNS